MSTSTKTPAVTHEDLAAVLDTVRELTNLTLGLTQKIAERTDMVIGAQDVPARWFNLRSLGRGYESIQPHETIFDPQTRNLGENVRQFDRLNSKLVTLVQKLEANAAKAA